MKESNTNFSDELIPPDNYLFFSFFTTFLCFFPFGIIAIIYSFRIAKLWNLKKYEQARIVSDKALKFGQLAFIVGLVLWFIAFMNLLF